MAFCADSLQAKLKKNYYNDNLLPSVLYQVCLYQTASSLLHYHKLLTEDLQYSILLLEAIDLVNYKLLAKY